MNDKKDFWEKNGGVVLGLGVFVLAIATLFARLAFPEAAWASAVAGALLFANFVLLLRHHQQALRTRTAAYGLNSAITILLVLGLLTVVNFMAQRYPHKFDLTRNKVNTFSDQTIKLIKGLKQPVKAAVFVGSTQREQYRPVLDNYHNLNSTKFEIEYVDPNREPTRTRAAGVKKPGTTILSYNGHESKIEEITEEKITNALLKLTKDKSQTLCAIIGHGEKAFTGNDADGYDMVRKALVDQDYEVKDVNLVTEQGKVPAFCDAIAIVGPTKAFFEPEAKAVQDYLAGGGHAVIALDVNIKGAPYAPELVPVLAAWNIKPENSLVVDPVSRMFNVDASMPIIATFSKTNPVTRDFGVNTPAAFPIARPLTILQSTPGITPDGIGKTTAQSFAVSDFKGISGGELKVDPSLSQHGPFSVAVSVDGKQKDSKATRNTRLVVFGSSLFGTNNFSRFGVNLDFFVNAVSWVLQDESMISIRAKEDGPGKIDISQKTGSIIFLLTVLVIPAMIAIGGVVIWAYRRRL